MTRHQPKEGNPDMSIELDMTPTWSALVPAMVAVLQNDSDDVFVRESRQSIIGQFERMASAADMWNAHVTESRAADNAARQAFLRGEAIGSAERPASIGGVDFVGRDEADPINATLSRAYKTEPYPEFAVTLTLRLSCNVSFDPGSNPTKQDAIDNAIGRLPDEVFRGFGGEFEVALPIDGEAHEE